MRRIYSFTKRNTLVYLSNKAQIVFSLLTSIIVLVLYLLFLKNTYTKPIVDSIKGMNIGISAEDILLLTDSNIIASCICLSTITIPITVLQTMVIDREEKIDYDILASPLKRYEIVLGYFLSAVILSFIISSILSLVGFSYMYFKDKSSIDVINVLKVIFINLLASLSSTSIFMIFLSFIKRQATLSGFYGLFSAIIGFVVGAYIPLSALPKSAARIFLYLPQTQLNVLYKRGFSSIIIENIKLKADNKFALDFIQEYKESFGLSFDFLKIDLSNKFILIYVSLIILISLVLAMFIYKKRYKK